jgi:hypothetical protein
MSAPGTVSDVRSREKAALRSPLYLERMADAAEQNAAAMERNGALAVAETARRAAANMRQQAQALRRNQ